MAFRAALKNGEWRTIALNAHTAITGAAAFYGSYKGTEKARRVLKPETSCETAVTVCAGAMAGGVAGAFIGFTSPVWIPGGFLVLGFKILFEDL